MDYSFKIIIQGYVYAKYNASITSATIVSRYNNKKGYTNYKSNNANTQSISMLSDIINGNAYLKFVSIHQMETLKVQVASVSIHKIETHQQFKWSTDRGGRYGIFQKNEYFH